MSFHDPNQPLVPRGGRDIAMWRTGVGRLSLALGTGVGLVLIASYALLWGGTPLRDTIISEGGWVESLSAYLYLVVAAILLVVRQLQELGLGLSVR